MNGVTTAIVAFCFAGLAWQGLVKNRHQYYVGLGAALAIILFDGLAHAVGSPGFAGTMYMFCAVLQIIAVISLVLCAGGISFEQFRGEVGQTIEVLRRGETGKETIIPLPEEIRRKVDEAALKAERAKMANPPADKPADASGQEQNKSGPLPLA